MPNYARFAINGSPSSAGGYDGEHDEALTLALETAPAGIIWQTTFAVYDPDDDTSPLASKSAPALTLVGATSGLRVQALTPDADVTTTLPSSGIHSWIVRCTVNGGLNSLGRPDADFVFDRLVAIRTDGGMRKEVLAEGSAYSRRGYADTQNEIVDAILSGVDFPGGGGGGATWVAPVIDRDLATPPGSPNAGDRYLIASGATGAWSGHALEIAEWSGVLWSFAAPEDGTTVWIDDEDLELTWTGTAWVQSGLPTTAALDDVLLWNGTAWIAGAVPTGFSVSTFSGPTTTQETGATITTPSFTASYSAAPSSASVSDNVGAGSTAWSNPYTSGTRAGSFSKSTSGQSVTFTLSAVRGGTTATKTLTVTWASRVFYGVANIPGGYTEAFIEGLASSVVSTTRARTIAISASGAQHVYYCLPVSYGTPTFTTNGLSGGFTKIASAVSVTNANGATTTYDVWESNQAGIGSQSIVIT